MMSMVAYRPHKQKNILGDRSNVKKEEVKKFISKKNSIERTVEPQEIMSEDGSIENSLPDFEHFRSRFGSGFIQYVLGETHHQSDSLDELVEDILEDVSNNIYVGDKVRWKKDTEPIFTVYFSEKRGGTRMLKLKSEEGKENADLINQNDVKRLEKVVEDDIRDLISTAATKTASHWVVNKTLCDEYKLKDKIASIFISRTPGKKAFSLIADQSASSEEDEDDKPLAELHVVRRSSMGIAPSKKTIVTPKVVNDKKISAKDKKRHEMAEKKGQKEAEKLAKKELKEKEKAEKQKEKAEKKTQKGAINKFVVSGIKGSSEGSSTPFLTPAKREEKKFEALLVKLRKEFNKGNKDAFNALCTTAGKDLKAEQVDSIPEELIRFSVKKVFNREKDREAMKNMSTDEKVAYREKVNGERKDAIKLNIQLKTHFDECSQREDLLVCASDLPLFGNEIVCNSSTFDNCLVLTQALHSLTKFLDHNFKIGAEELYELLSKGYKGYVHGLGKILEILLGFLQQDSDFKILHCGQRVRHFTTDLQAVSDMCRAILIGLTELPRERDRKKEKSDETAENEEQIEDEEFDESGNVEQLERSQSENQEISTLLERFSAELELWNLSASDQIDIAMYVMQNVLDSQLYADYLQGGVTEKEHEIRFKIDKEKTLIEANEMELKEIPAIPNDVDESTMSRIESRVLEKNRMKRAEIERSIERSAHIIEEQEEKLELERSSRENAWRQIPLGMDRHFRLYWFFGKYAPNRGLWIQDLGMTSSEHAIKTSEKASLNGEQTEDEQMHVEPSTSEKWWCVREVAEVDRLMKSLNEVGSREKALKEALVKLKPKFAEQNNLPQILVSSKDDDDEPVGSLFALKESIQQFTDEIFEKRMSSIKDSEDFQAGLECAKDLKTVAGLIAELVESIPSTAIQQRIVSTSAVYTFERWLPQVQSAANCSHLFMLLDMVQARIDWGASVNNKRCKKCGKRSQSEMKLVCAKCSTCYHMQCLRRKLEEMPDGEWQCADCKPESEQTSSMNGKNDGKFVNYAEESDPEDDQEKDDFFKARRRSTRKRVVVDSDFDDDIEENLRSTRVKRGKMDESENPATQECRDILKKIKSARIYTSLSNIPSQRSSRNHKESQSIVELEENIYSFKSLDEFKNRLRTFFEVARTHFQEMSLERKIEQLDEVMSAADI